ncbi:DNA/RNA non-specific endonuclease [Luteibacter yeojuensis]|uniref:Type VII secretion system protein EssD-like domain-containing protein n=1 Tax=Luteibacter yeojuensis TaxID=345309 RepID=A0A7X5TPD9_9GAMM|nr:DNA/RNA non-specific endonuclease [Luteibacter yeojuensis]NID14688.1 hypothetical protein [Luteibacter yeojuensis]
MKDAVQDERVGKGGSPVASAGGRLPAPPIQRKVDTSPRQRHQESHLSRLREAPVDGNAPIQRKIAIPAFSGANPVSSLYGLPASTANYTTQTRGAFNVPATSSARLGAFKAGSGAINTNLTFALQAINDMRGGIYERCHLLAHKLGGEGVPANIVPATKTFNAAALNDIEAPIIEARQQPQKRLFQYTVTANYGDHANANLRPVETLLPTSFGYSLQEYHWTGAGSSTQIANWTAQPAMNLGADAVKQNDLSALGALHSDAPHIAGPTGSLGALIDHFTNQVATSITKIELSQGMRAFISGEVQAAALQGIASGERALPRDAISGVVDYMHARTGAIADRAVGDELVRQTQHVTADSLALVNRARQTITEKLTYDIDGVQQVDRTGLDAAMRRIEALRATLLERCRNLLAQHERLAEFTAPLDLLNDFAADVSEETSRASLYT